MATSGIESGLEVPVADGYGGSATAKVTLVKSSTTPRKQKKKFVPVPEMDTPEWEDWAKAREVSRVVAQFRRMFGKDDAILTDPIVLEGLLNFAEKQVAEAVDEPSCTLTWAPKKDKTNKKFSWFMDVPYYGKNGKAIEGPVSSCLTFDEALPVA